MSQPLLPTVIWTMTALRTALGVLPFVAAGLAVRLMGFPAAHDSASTRLMGRLFGVRDVALGALAVHGLLHPEQLPFAVMVNAGCDAGDMLAIAIPLLRRQGIDRAALSCLGCAVAGLLGWLAVLRFLL